VLVDAFGRVADDLRVSVTDRCNLRCTYCMPAEGMRWLPRAELLTYEEIDRLVGVFMSLGVTTVRLTGGEPLARREVATLVRMLAARAVPDLSMTTNGVLLAKHADELARAGLRRVNVSLDSLVRHRYEAMTRRDALERVFEGVRAAQAAGLTPVKLNCVVVRGTNDDEIVDFARLARETGYDVRFIEVMPLDEDRAWSRDQVVPSADVLAAIDAAYPLEPIEHGPEPAKEYRFADGARGSIGVIASVTEPFCGSCNRLRLTVDGRMRNCLFAMDETDLRGPMRAGASDDELAELIRACVASKWAGHRINEAGFEQPSRSMSLIGG